MDEILELRRCLEEHRYEDAFFIINEMEEMAKDDKINKISSYAIILLLHIVKQHAEHRLTASWQHSIRHALRGIAKTNKRRSSGGVYLGKEQLVELLDEVYAEALDDAATEAFGGVYGAKHLATLVDAEAVKAQALEYILHGYPESED